MFAIGQRVAIVSGLHPWFGASGVIVDSWRGDRSLGLDWEIQLTQGDYDGHTVAASTDDLIPDRRSHDRRRRA